MTFYNDKRCPRCGREYQYIEQRRQGNQTYFYAVHIERIGNGKRRVRKCYLGPLVYQYVSKLHEREGLVLKGLLETNRVFEYLEAILQSLIENNMDPELRRDIARKLRFYADLIEKT